jgi:hypothetical protein
MCLLLENEMMLVSQMQSNYHSSCIQGRIWMNVSISTYEISFIRISVAGKKKFKRGLRTAQMIFLRQKRPKVIIFMILFLTSYSNYYLCNLIASTINHMSSYLSIIHPQKQIVS